MTTTHEDQSLAAMPKGGLRSPCKRLLSAIPAAKEYAPFAIIAIAQRTIGPQTQVESLNNMMAIIPGNTGGHGMQHML